jgi:hypothetical protein
LPPSCAATWVSCGFEQKSVIVWTVWRTTISPPSCTATTVVIGTSYGDDPPGECNQ